MRLRERCARGRESTGRVRGEWNRTYVPAWTPVTPVHAPAGRAASGEVKAMPKKTVYIETSVVSCLTAWPTADLRAAAWQASTAEWWETQRRRFDLRTSEIAIEGIGEGDPEAEARGRAVLAGVPVLPTTEPALELSDGLVRGGALPATAANDGLQVALAAVHGVDYLLTWNFRHLDNAETKPVMRSVCARYGRRCPEICTPRELGGSGGTADEIIEELWRIKDDMAREHGYDVERLAAYFRRCERESEAREARATRDRGEPAATDG